jgi:hypothetical protein
MSGQNQAVCILLGLLILGVRIMGLFMVGHVRDQLPISVRV